MLEPYSCAWQCNCHVTTPPRQTEVTLLRNRKLRRELVNGCSQRLIQDLILKIRMQVAGAIFAGVVYLGVRLSFVVSAIRAARRSLEFLLKV